jgi:hypothetical protein
MKRTDLVSVVDREPPVVLGRGLEYLRGVIFVMTASFTAFPPLEIPPEKRGALLRRLSAYHIEPIRDEKVAPFAQWYMSKTFNRYFGDVSFQCGDLTAELSRLHLRGRTPAELQRELSPIVDETWSAVARVVKADQHLSNVDLTEHLREAISKRA